MSYPKDLDEYTNEELEKELRARAELRAKGICDYCGRNGASTPCKFPERHQVAVDYLKNLEQIKEGE
jgi:hypothetical protein